MFTFPIPESGVNGDVLAAALGVPSTCVCVVGDELVVNADLDEAAVTEIVAGHVPPPPPPPPPTVEDLVDARIAAALEGANTFAEFKSALLGA